MKTHLLFLLLSGIALLPGCSKDTNHGRLDPNSKLAINSPKTGKAETGGPAHWTPLEIVKGTSAIRTKGGAMGIPDASRDLVNERIMLLSFNIINSSGELVDLFIGSRDVVFEHWKDDGTPAFDPNNIIRDTIAYIPNAVLEVAQAAITKAYNEEDYATVYKLFNDAYTFYPITGAEWRALKAEGKQ